MTSSMQLAKECLSQKLTDDTGESFQPFEGLEKFAETIETGGTAAHQLYFLKTAFLVLLNNNFLISSFAVLRRVKVTFLDTVFRIEHIPENFKTGIALEIRISK